MAYPPAPWTLKGAAVQTIRLVDIQRARGYIPAPLKIVPVLPGKTLGVVYFADYQPGSVLVYHELIIAAALVRLGRRVGFWISHIYVDSPDSMAGGREIWGLPKQLARFDWDPQAGRAAAWQGDQLLCAFEARSPAAALPMPVFLPVISLLGSQAMTFHGNVATRLGLSRGRVEVTAGSPFADLGLAGPATAFHLRRMTFRASAPAVIGQVQPAPARSQA